MIVGISIILFAVLSAVLENIRHRRFEKNIHRETLSLLKQAEIRHKVEFMVDNFDPVDTLPYTKPLTRAEIEFNEKLMFEYLEAHPDSPFWDSHPEYKEKYLSKIDLTDLMNGE